ncbi:MAG TPA: nicotinate-nucleotide--dimethylbenzimidazole phosphoribosyltransferase [Actinomycetota bacterium]
MSELLDRTIARVRAPDEEVARRTAASLDAKTKPPGSLGRLEELAIRLAAIRGEPPAGPLHAAVVVAAADHGVAAQGVSAYPSEVTGQMLAAFANGGAAVSVLARKAGARLVVVDAGVAGTATGTGSEVGDDVRSAVVGGVRGTADITGGPAMDRSTATALLARGIELADELARDGIGVVAVGDMGIANTTSASALCAALLPAEPAAVCGRGTGVDDAGLARKVDAVRRGLAANGLGDGVVDARTALAAVGGLEIAFLAGVILGCAAGRVPVLLDGFVTGSAALVAAGLAPQTPGSLIAATRSPEPGHDPVLRRLGLEPLLDLGLRLGEGSGATLALPLLGAAVAILTDMSTFEEAGVTSV